MVYIGKYNLKLTKKLGCLHIATGIVDDNQTIPIRGRNVFLGFVVIWLRI